MERETTVKPANKNLHKRVQQHGKLGCTGCPRKKVSIKYLNSDLFITLIDLVVLISVDPVDLKFRLVDHYQIWTTVVRFTIVFIRCICFVGLQIQQKLCH